MVEARLGESSGWVGVDCSSEGVSDTKRDGGELNVLCKRTERERGDYRSFRGFFVGKDGDDEMGERDRFRIGLFCREKKKLKKVEGGGIDRIRNGEAPRFFFLNGMTEMERVV